MSTHFDRANVGPMSFVGAGSRRWTLVAAFVIAAAGLFAFSYQLHVLWGKWTTDALRSVGIMVPPVSLWLAIRQWKAYGWKVPEHGSWWGLPLVVSIMALGILTAIAPMVTGFWLELENGRSTMVAVPLPTGMLLSGYFSGVVILLGGFRAWKLLVFPLLLLLLVNPVPSGFQSIIDLPSQVLGARVARGFAQLIGVPVEGEALKLMFSPTLGIFIAPGCNGMRGAVAMGLFALLLGYLRQLRWLYWTVFVVGAVMLAYLMNLVRLCAVIGYYWVALRVPALGQYGAEIDYVIGGSIFFATVYLLLRFTRTGQQTCAQR